MIQKFNKSLFLFKLLTICIVFLFFHRVLFFLLFYNLFGSISFIEYFKAFLVGTLTDAIVSVYFLLPTWLILLFFNIKNPVVKSAALVWFAIGFTILCILNIADLAYYPITKKRMGGELLDMLAEVPALMSSYLKDYWYLVILLIGFILVAFYTFKKQLLNYTSLTQKPAIKFANVIIVIAVFFIIMRGGFSARPFMPFDIPSLVKPKLQWLASNTPFQILHTFENKNFTIQTYFDESEAEQLIGLKKHYTSSGFKKKNILFIILESFSSERVGLFNPAVKSYTPFFDSLLATSRTYKYGMANGRMTIDALPSVLSGIPSLMEKNYCYSNYSNNNVNGISSLLDDEGYTNAFFYGGLKTTFGFQNFMNINFTKNYFDQDDFDKSYENSGWGVDDHLFLPFIAKKIKTLPQPFCAALLTLSLHHPFPVPEPYLTLLDTIKDPVKKSMKYTDLALQLFFNEIKNEEWYKNSIIAICADHTSSGFGNFQGNTINEFGIPISFLAVGDTAFNKVQSSSISQIDMYPTILDYLGYDKSFISLGNSALSHQQPTIQYIGNGLYLIFDYPYQLQYDVTLQKVTNFRFFKPDRTVEQLTINDSNRVIATNLTNQIKAYLQVFSYRINKNQF